MAKCILCKQPVTNEAAANKFVYYVGEAYGYSERDSGVGATTTSIYYRGLTSHEYYCCEACKQLKKASPRTVLISTLGGGLLMGIIVLVILLLGNGSLSNLGVFDYVFAGIFMAAGLFIGYFISLFGHHSAGSFEARKDAEMLANELNRKYRGKTIEFSSASIKAGDYRVFNEVEYKQLQRTRNKPDHPI